MTSGRTEVLDQYGVPWLVYPDDPAAELIKRLKVEYIVLPRETLLTGEVYPVSHPSFESIPVEAITPKLAEVIKRTTRLYDIYHHLTESTSGNLPDTNP